MPRIRKKTSNRVKLKDRASIAKKVKETRRKRAKAAKKNPQWKSKTPKDPGIPNDFPYKDEILAEVAEQRRAAAEEKARRKLEKQRARTGVTEDAEDDAMELDLEEDKPGKNKLDVGAEAILNLAAKSPAGELKPAPPKDDVESEEEEEDEAPLLINRELETLQAVLDEADVVVEVLDARDPLETRSQFVEKYASEKEKKLVLVLTKIDTCPRESVSAWLSHLRSQGLTTFAFKTSSTFVPLLPGQQPPKSGKKSKAPANDSLGADAILSYLNQLAQEKEGDKALAVAVVGVTNVGKTALVNSLTKTRALTVYTLSDSSRSATTTELPQEVTADALRFIDTPGLTHEYDHDAPEAQQFRSRDILVRNRGRIDRLKDPAPPLVHLVPRCNHEDLMLLYNLPAFAKGDETAFLQGVARANGLVKKRGELDLAGAARVVLRDWSTGKFARYAMPPSAAATPTTSTSDASRPEWLDKLYTKDQEILTALVPRKELRKTTGLVRLTAGAVDARGVDLSEKWAALEEEESDDDEDAEEFGGISMEVDEDEEDSDEDEDEEMEDDEDEEDESEEEEPVAPPPSSKGKRKAQSQAVARPTKKVAFAAKPEGKSKPQPRSKDDSALQSALKKKPAAAAPAAKAQKSAPKTSVKAAVEPLKRVANKAATKAKDSQDKDAYDFTKFFK